MSPEQYRQLTALAEVALQMTTDRRAAFIDEVCGSDAELRKRLRALVAADSASHDFLGKPLLEELADGLREVPAHRELAGQRIASYEVISRLGAGGIGEVWLARDSSLGREVALKLLSLESAGDPHHVRRFQQEARAASALNHPNIVTVYEIGQTEDGLFIAEERVAGETVRERIERGRMPLREILEIGRQAATALGAAHSGGVVHRDIKPENVMVRPDGFVKVLDFGLARFAESGAAGESVVSLSIPGFVLGTVRYMSPEQARGLPVDGRSDIFSLGVMLYEMSTGTPPFSGETPTDTLAAILTTDPPPLSRLAPGLPPQFERIVRRCLEKEAGARYPTAGELQDDLVRLAAQMARPARFRRWGFAAAAACAVLAAMAFTYFLRNRRQAVTPFSAMEITRVATRGEPSDSAISPDGRLLAYVAHEGAGESVRIKQVSGADETAAVTAEPGEHSGLTFSPDGSVLYYRRRNAEGTSDLYRAPVAGGSPERIFGDVSGAAAVSPDGRRLAFVRLKPSSWESSLVVGSAEGGGESTLATLRRPRSFVQHGVAWAPDGRSIALFTGEGARYSESTYRLVEVRVSDGNLHPITDHVWGLPRSIAWSGASDFLNVTTATRGDDIYQIWKVDTAPALWRASPTI